MKPQFINNVNRVLKYGLFPNERLRPFTKSAIEDIKKNREDKRTFDDWDTNVRNLGILADFLQDHDDPRGDIIRRHLENPQWSKNITPGGVWVGLKRDTSFKEETPEDESNIYLNPVYTWPKDIIVPSSLQIERGKLGKPHSVYMAFNHMMKDENDNLSGQGASAIFTPEEARHIISKFPEAHQKQLNALMETHFPTKSE